MIALAHNPKRRFGLSLAEAVGSARFNPALADAPPLPAVDFAQVGRTAPALPVTPAGALPKAIAVVISWTEAEWAAMNQVFCGSGDAMPYGARATGAWPGWRTLTAQMPADPPQGWSNWGAYRLVQIGSAPVLLFKSNTHLDFPGADYLESMIRILIEQVQPGVILSVGTAGGAKPTDHVGTVRAVSAGALFEQGQPQTDWPVYANAWRPSAGLLGAPGFGGLLNPVPTSPTALAALCAAFNQHYGGHYSLQDLDPDGLNRADPLPQVVDQTGGAEALLTTPTFAVATTAGNFADFAAVEMDDAVIGEACGSTTAFGFIRNLSDPVQSAALPTNIQGAWGSAVYDVFGFYTSYNGALAAWAMLA